MALNLYEVIRWGNDSDDLYTGGPNGPDTCFLVRAGTPDAAALLADEQLKAMSARSVRNWSQAVYLLGVDGGTDARPRVLRGPYIEHAYRYGWRQWARDAPDAPWLESVGR